MPQSEEGSEMPAEERATRCQTDCANAMPIMMTPIQHDARRIGAIWLIPTDTTNEATQQM